MYTLSENYKKFIEDNPSQNKSIYGVEKILSNKEATNSDLINFAVQNDQFKNMKVDVLDYLISYVYYILSDHYISEEELYDFTALKRIFRVKPGDFMSHKRFEVVEILKQQFIRMYSDDFIDQKEAFTKTNLQFMFDLSHDEFEKLKEDEVIISLINGANPKDLDISSLPKGFKF